MADEKSSITKDALIKQIWNIMNNFRLAHFLTRPRNMISISDFDAMMEQVRRELLLFEESKII